MADALTVWLELQQSESVPLIRVDGRPLFNPSNFGLLLGFMLLGSRRVDPLDFWWVRPGVALALALTVIVVGGLLLAWRVKMLGVVSGFWLTYAVALGVLAARGHCITARWHGEEGARAGEAHFTQVVRRHEAPDEVPELQWAADAKPVHLPAVLKAQFGQTTSHWRRQIDQGGVKVNGQAAASYDLDPGLLDGAVVQAGRRQFVRVHLV